MGFAWLLMGVILTTLVVVSLLTFRIGVQSYMHVPSNLVGKLMLRLMGIRLRVVGAEHIKGRKMRIIAMNHTSQLDIFIFASLVPPYGVPIAKKEIARVPFIGWAFFAFKTLLIDRSNLEKSKASFAKASERLRNDQASVIIAPEGTRSRTGELGDFKMGLFHLAAASKAPIVPAIVRGARECQPMGTLLPHPGVVEVEFLPEISTQNFEADNLHHHRDALRKLFIERLAA